SEGWLVSSSYGQGLQRYYVTAAKHGCVTGYSTAGWAHYTTPAGYVARGAYDTGAGRVYVANNDGRLAWGTSTGWVVQNYGSGLQRYYVSASDHGACSGFFSVAGYGRCFGVGGAGYVMRGKMGWGSTVLLADNEGKLATQSGWLVTGAYDGGTLQRYYMVNAWSDYKGARTGWFTVSGSNFYGRNTVGYVARNGYIQHNGSWYQADNDGKLTRVTSGKIGWQNPSWMYQVSCYNASLPSYAEGYFTYVTPSRIAINASRQDCVNAFMGRAYDYLGSPYIWDYAMQPGVGVDCAGLVIQCLYAVGINSVYNPYDHMYDPWQDHDATNMYNDSKFEHVSISNISYGDLVFYSGHIAIYIGNGQVINATSPSEGVVINSVYRFSIIGVGRVFA
ncbi:MAG: NlpC/P60 family protein, partial [Atopobiaceae bacterium]|nr:NlpC/P60 family protein [Atopobiaceae bacterium]